MIESASLENFRGFKKAELSALRRVNIIVGDNGAGKTALLEGLFLVSGPSPEIALRLRIWRSLDLGTGSSATDTYNALFAPLFRNFDLKNTIAIATNGEGHSKRALEIRYDADRPTAISLDTRGSPATGPVITAPVVFTWTNEFGEQKSVVPRMSGNQLELGVGFPVQYDPSFLASRGSFPNAQNAAWYSELSKRNEDSAFANEVRLHFPDLASLSVEIDGGAPALWAAAGKRKPKLPINLMSEGLTKLVTILLHIARSAKASVFIDEIENGFHYSRHERLWRSIYGFAKRYDTQVFATTHSLECLKATLPTMRKNPDRFSLIRVFRKGDDNFVTSIEGKEAVSIIESGIEVRK